MMSSSAERSTATFIRIDTQQYVVTFKSPDSYMEVPGWHRGDLAFSFRTSSERAILLYQPLLHPKHPYFRVLLVDGKLCNVMYIYML